MGLFPLHDRCRISFLFLHIVLKAVISVLFLNCLRFFFPPSPKMRLTLNYFIIAFEESEGRAGLIMAKNQVCKLVVH